MIQVGKTVLDGQVVHRVADLSITITVGDLARVDEFMEKLDALCAKLGIPPSGTIIEGSIAHPVTDPTRLIGNEVRNG